MLQDGDAVEAISVTLCPLGATLSELSGEQSSTMIIQTSQFDRAEIESFHDDRVIVVKRNYDGHFRLSALVSLKHCVVRVNGRKRREHAW